MASPELHAGRRRADQAGGKEAHVALQLLRSGGGLELHERRERDHLAVAGADVHAARRGGVHAVGGLGLDQDAVGPAGEGEVVGVDHADGGLQGLVELGSETPSEEARTSSTSTSTCGTAGRRKTRMPVSSGRGAGAASSFSMFAASRAGSSSSLACR
jgi:hypothetical protein